jgi:2-iminobutanoate/2-iminopropanoate deaminase
MAKTYVTEGPGLPRWENPISHAVVAGNTCIVSGQLSVSEEGAYVEAPFEEELARALGNFLSAVEAAGFSRADIVFVDFAVTDLSRTPAIDRAFAQAFEQGRRPARTLYEVRALPFGGKVKVMGTAIREGWGAKAEARRLRREG